MKMYIHTNELPISRRTLHLHALRHGVQACALTVQDVEVIYQRIRKYFVVFYTVYSSTSVSVPISNDML